MNFSWHCPFCNHHSTITSNNTGSNRYEFNFDNKYGYQAFTTHVISCPNPDCKQYTLSVTLHDHVKTATNPEKWSDLEAKKIWNLIPQALIKVFPEYIPAQ